MKPFYVFALCASFMPLTALAQNKPTAPIHILSKPVTPKFQMPLSCTLGTDCWIMNYTDTGPDADGAGIDPFCNARTYEGHKGTDFAIPDETTMKKGVDVLAAHAGTISRVRNGEADLWATKEDLDKIRAANKDCGNAVLIDHGHGWQTLSCHLKNNSITVKPGQTIKAGDKIGQVGLSGYTQFPHLHFGLIHESKVIDPFTGADITKPCDQIASPLWAPTTSIKYEPLDFFAGGFETEIPSLEKLERTRTNLKTLPADAKAFVYYSVILGIREKDDITMTIKNSAGKVFAQSHTVQDKNRARQMYFVGRKITNRPEPGTYKGEISITRKNKNGEKMEFKDEYSIVID